MLLQSIYSKESNSSTPVLVCSTKCVNFTKKAVRRYFSGVVFGVGLINQPTQVENNRSFAQRCFNSKYYLFLNITKKMEPKQKQSATGNKQSNVSTWYLKPALLGQSPVYTCPPIPPPSADFLLKFASNMAWMDAGQQKK